MIAALRAHARAHPVDVVLAALDGAPDIDLNDEAFANASKMRQAGALLLFDAAQALITLRDALTTKK